MKKSDWGIQIIKKSNHYQIKLSGGETIEELAYEENEKDALEAMERILWEILDHFSINYDSYAKEKLSIIREAGRKYAPKSDENVKLEYYPVIIKKN